MDAIQNDNFNTQSTWRGKRRWGGIYLLAHVPSYYRKRCVLLLFARRCHFANTRRTKTPRLSEQNVPNFFFSCASSLPSPAQPSYARDFIFLKTLIQGLSPLLEIETKGFCLAAQEWSSLRIDGHWSQWLQQSPARFHLVITAIEILLRSANALSKASLKKINVFMQSIYIVCVYIQLYT